MSTEDCDSKERCLDAPSHSELLLEDGVVTLKRQSISDIFSRLKLKFHENNAEASGLQECIAFKKHWNTGHFESESELQDSLSVFLKHFLPHKNILKDRGNENQSKVFVAVYEKSGVPSTFAELNITKSHGLAKGKRELMRRVKHVLSQYVSVNLLPFVFFTGREFCVGFAEWDSYASLEIAVDDVCLSIYDENGEFNCCNLANLLQLFKWTAQLRLTQIKLEGEKPMYKLIQVGEYREISVVYYAEEMPAGGEAENDEVWVDPSLPPELADRVRRMCNQPKYAAVKFSKRFQSLATEIKINALLPEQHKVGWFFGKVFKLKSTEGQCCECVETLGDAEEEGKDQDFLIVGPLYVPLVRGF